MKQFNIKKSSDFKTTIDERGDLIAFNEIEKFSLSRFFLITCKKGNWRGKHYHKINKQVIFCLEGALKVKISNSNECNEEEMLPGMFFEQYPQIQFEFCAISEEAKILVICDSPHDPHDYYVSDI
jgi:hypothetical protein